MQGYNQSIEACLSTEFSHLNGITYLDHTGTTLYAASQLTNYHEDLMHNVYGNPHSGSSSSRLSMDTVEQVRYRILQHFNTTPDLHSVIFTSGCTGALKLLANTFDWSGCNVSGSTHNASDSTHNASDSTHNASDSTHNAMETTQDTSASPGNPDHQCRNVSSGLFCYLEDNHTSVIGMRENAKEKGAQVAAISTEKIDQILQDGAPSSYHLQNSQTGTSNCLFAYPGQSNFSGRKYPLSWCTKVKQGQLSYTLNCSNSNWYVVLDAAALASTSQLDLSNCMADFITVSFYKMFGFPTGLGALIVRKDAEQVLRKVYFGGGTVLAYLSGEQFHAPKKSLAEWFEDGTVPFLDIVAVRHGLDVLQRLAGSMSSIQQHTFTLAKYVHNNMAAYRHGNGMSVARLYCHNRFDDNNMQGPIINFNLLRPNGEFVGYAEVDSLAALHDIHLRTGCFCNTGACQMYLDLSSQQVKDNYQAGHVCGDDMDIINGQPTGSISISFGYMSTKQDADHFLQFIQDCFVKRSSLSASPITNDVNVKNKEMENANKDEAIDKGETMVHETAADNDRANILLENSHPPHKTEMQGKDQSEMNVLGKVVSSDLEGSAFASKIDVGCHGDRGIARGVEAARNAGNKMVLTNIYLYPIKSLCGAMEVCEWELGPRGLLYDRHWMIVNSSGVCLSQKRESKMCLIKPDIDLNTGMMTLTYPGLKTLEVPLKTSQVAGGQVTVSKLCHSKVCGDRVEMLDCGDTVAEWLSSALGKSCRLLQQNDNFKRDCKFKEVLASDQKAQLSLAQESPYLLLNRSSCKVLLENIHEKYSHMSEKRSIVLSTGQEKYVEIENLLGRFRGNFVIDNVSSFQEDKWKKMQIGQQVFMVGGLCTRCQMICINQDTAERSKEPLMTLTTFRGKRVPFGIHLLRDPSLSTSAMICINDVVTVMDIS
ncbi:LOW QUALITY PROTEIN: molybdenum cofactor sulfurase-like [Amphiura filiformis]|uniref:LOW QUALITY PROTEIN: molybdenum cofactor sulfurase-like n=1 Tax=Amphiura filiformis TaxID=82378 RepID=UPI003B2193F7